MPDEDEQLRRIVEQDESAWHTVPVGGKRGKKKHAVQQGADTTETENSEPETNANLAVKAPEKQPEQQPQQGNSTSPYTHDLNTPICELTW